MLAGIHLSQIPPLGDELHFFHEETVTSATAYPHADGEEFLRLATALSVQPVVTTYPFEAADHALEDLRQGSVNGVAVLQMQ